jgi:GAF domain-containing protein
MVSAAAETESRLQGLARGADDYVSKPFSPKELIARIRNLLARAAESRDARRRGLLAERELQGAREEAKRSQVELKDEQHLRDLGRVLRWGFEGLLDDDRLTARVLLEARSQIGAGTAVLFRSEASGEPMAIAGLRTELPEPMRRLEIMAAGELVELLRGLGRPVRLRELERFRELSGETAPLAAAGFTVLVPLRGPERLEGILATAERQDGRDLTRRDLDVLAVLGESAGLALHHAALARAQAECVLDALGPMASRALSRSQRHAGTEAASWSLSAGKMVLSRRARSVLARALTLVPWAHGSDGRRALDHAAERDLSGWCREVQRLIATSEDPAAAPSDAVETRRAAALLLAAEGYRESRAGGLDPARAAVTARARAADLLDPPTRDALAMHSEGTAIA